MATRKKTQEVMAQAAELRRASEDVFLDSMRTELDVVRTMCILATQEKGERRTHHVQQAEKAFESVLELGKRVQPSPQDRHDIEEALQCIRQLGGRDFS